MKTKIDKPKDPNYTSMTVFITKDIHRKLKFKALVDDQNLRDKVEEILVEYINREVPNKIEVNL